MTAHFPDDPPPRWHNPVLALGNFDGLHRGHAKIIDRVRRRAGERGGTPAAMTFDPHPPRVVRPDKAPPLLMTTVSWPMVRFWATSPRIIVCALVSPSRGW